MKVTQTFNDYVHELHKNREKASVQGRDLILNSFKRRLRVGKLQSHWI